MFRKTKEIIRKLIMLQILVAMLCLSACGNDETDSSTSRESIAADIETTSVVNDESTTAESIDETTSVEITSEIESDASEEITSEISGDDTTVVEGTAAESDTTEETSVEEETTDESTTKKQETTANKETTTKKQNTTANKETTTKKQQNTTKQTTTKKPEPTTEEETTTNIEDIPDGVVWWYDSNIYADHPEKSELENKFWSMYGWTTFSKAKNDAMTRAVVELAYEIMNTYDTEFEREKALYDAICERVEYDYEDYYANNLTHVEGGPYGALVEGKAVCAGYAKTFETICELMGIECRYVTGWARYNGGRHAWNQVCIDGEWYEVDCTWGDNTEGWGYYYFNVTTEQMSIDHKPGYSFQCTGTKYNEAYLAEQYTEEFLKDKVYFTTVDECMNYINNQIENGNVDMTVYFSFEIFDEITDMLWEYKKWEERYPLSKEIKNMYYRYSYHAERETRYKYVNLTTVSKLTINFKKNEYESLENYCYTQEDCDSYIEKQLEKGATEIEIWKDPSATFVIAAYEIPAPEGMEWIWVESGDVPDSYSNIKGRSIYYVKYQCVEKTESDIE